MNWQAKFDRACGELRDAEAKWKFAQEVLAIANAKLAEARVEVHACYQERELLVNGAAPPSA